MHTKCTLRNRTEDGTVGSIDTVETELPFAQAMQLRGRTKEDPSFHNDERNANARRMAACWNACAQITTDELENIAATGGMLGPREDVASIAQQRDELLAALKRIKADLMRQRLYGQDAGLLHAATQAEGDAEEAIAKAEA
jgi:hypothetical protein